MIKLDVTFESGEGGFSQAPLTYKQVVRNDRFAVYERSREGKVRDYEVIKIQLQKAGQQIFKQIIKEDTERYPSSSQWGFSAWSFRDKAAALNRFDTLTKEDTAGDEAPSKEATVVLPDKAAFSMKDLLATNPKIAQSRLYVALQKLIKAGKVTKSGTVEREGVGGKAAILYSEVK